jgi:hypothetical protein
MSRQIHAARTQGRRLAVDVISTRLPGHEFKNRLFIVLEGFPAEQFDEFLFHLARFLRHRPADAGCTGGKNGVASKLKLISKGELDI